MGPTFLILTFIFTLSHTLTHAFSLIPPSTPTAGVQMNVQWSMTSPGANKNYGIIAQSWPSSWPQVSTEGLFQQAQDLLYQKFPKGTDTAPRWLIRTNGQAQGSIPITIGEPGPVLLLAFSFDKTHVVASWPRVDIAPKVVQPPSPPPPPPSSSPDPKPPTETPITTVENGHTKTVTATISRSADSTATDSTKSDPTETSAPSPSDTTPAPVVGSTTTDPAAASKSTDSSVTGATSSSHQGAIIGGAAAGGAVMLVLLVVLVLLLRRRRRKQKLEKLAAAPFTPRYPRFVEQGRDESASEQTTWSRDEKRGLPQTTFLPVRRQDVEESEASSNPANTEEPASPTSQVEQPQTYNRAMEELAQRVMLLESLTQPPQYQPAERV